MSLQQLQPYFGFTRLPFGRQIPPAGLFRSRPHQEARARITFLIEQAALGLITGEVGSGKTCAARAPSQPSTKAATRSSTWPTRPSVPAASTPRSWLGWAAIRITTRPT